MIKSAYIHIPFCSHICSYCDFCKRFYNEKLASDYLDVLKEEILEKYHGEKLETIYVGGGTPSSLSIDNLKKLLEITTLLNQTTNCEFTMEVNAENIDEEKLLLMKKYGVNRISMGLESSNSELLKYLNRHHTYNDVFNKVNLMKKMGFNNINIDLIYAIPNETKEELLNDLKNIIDLNINHVSTYSLIINNNTVLGINKTKEIDQDLDYEMYQLIINYLTSEGFNHYEISNFSKDGYMSKHNLTYWHNEEYYGFGLGASGYIGHIRYDNTKSMTKYINKEYIYQQEELSTEDIISYALILGFRLVKGINKNEFYCRYNSDIKSLYNVQKLINSGDLIDDGSNIYISYDKIYVENNILINFI